MIASCDWSGKLVLTASTVNYDQKVFNNEAAIASDGGFYFRSRGRLELALLPGERVDHHRGYDYAPAQKRPI